MIIIAIVIGINNITLYIKYGGKKVNSFNFEEKPTIIYVSRTLRGIYSRKQFYTEFSFTDIQIFLKF